jgi:DNA adenine methylase
LGGAAVYLFLKKNNFINGKDYLSDLNPDLINCYRQLRNNYSHLKKLLLRYKNSEEFYYRIRKSIPNDNIRKAANFLYLNRTSFNGIFRVNLKGEYNVPFGFKSYKQLFDFETLDDTRKILRNSKLKVCDFQDTLSNIQENDLVFIDPPYTIAHNHNGFIKYNQKLFSWEDQLRLLEYIRLLNKANAFFILTNAAHKSILNLFENDSEVKKLSRPSLIGGKGAQRKHVEELIFTNIRNSYGK